MAAHYSTRTVSRQGAFPGGRGLSQSAQSMSDLEGWSKVAYVAACVVVPALWGAVTAWVFTRRDRRKAEADRRPPIDYHI